MKGGRGAALVIALVFLVLTGVLVGALVSESVPSFVTTRVVKDLQDSAAAAEAGAEDGIQALRTDSTLCAGPSATPSNLPAFAAVNGHAVTVTCQTNQGYAAGALGWGLITNYTRSAAITGTGTG